MEQKTIKMNAWQMVVFYERGQSTKNLGQSRKRCRWNSLKVVVQFSVQQLHCPGVNSKAKVTLNCRHMLLQIKKQLRLLFELFLPISSIFTELSQTCVTITIDQGNQMCWWDNQLHSWRMMHDPTYQNFLSQQYEERIERASTTRWIE